MAKSRLDARLAAIAEVIGPDRLESVKIAKQWLNMSDEEKIDFLRMHSHKFESIAKRIRYGTHPKTAIEEAFCPEVAHVLSETFPELFAELYRRGKVAKGDMEQAMYSRFPEKYLSVIDPAWRVPTKIDLSSRSEEDLIKDLEATGYTISPNGVAEPLPKDSH